MTMTLTKANGKRLHDVELQTLAKLEDAAMKGDTAYASKQLAFLRELWELIADCEPSADWFEPVSRDAE